MLRISERSGTEMIKNKHIDLIWRKLNPAYKTIEIECTIEQREVIQKAADLRGMNIHQYIEYALGEKLKDMRNE